MEEHKPSLVLTYKQADFLMGLLDAGGDTNPIQENAALFRAKTRHELAARNIAHEPMSVGDMALLQCGRVILASITHREEGRFYQLSHYGANVARLLSGQALVADGDGHFKSTELDGQQAYAIYEEPEPTPEPEVLKVPITGKHLEALLQALMGPGHLIRELQATINLPRDMTGDFVNPLREVLEEYNAFVEANTKKG